MKSYQSNVEIQSKSVKISGFRRLSRFAVGLTFSIITLTGAGCSIIDCSSLATADVLPVNNMRVMLKQPTNIDLESMMPEEISVHDIGAHFSPYTSVVLGYGLAKNLEVNAEVPVTSLLFLPTFATYGKIGGKMGVSTQDGMFKLAIAPAVSLGKYASTVVYVKDSHDDRESYTNTGLHGAIIGSYAPAKFLTGTISVKVDYYITSWKKRKWDDESRDYYVSARGTEKHANLGMYFSPRIKMGPFFIIPEVGLYMYEHKGNDIVMTPVFNLGIGGESKKREITN